MNEGLFYGKIHDSSCSATVSATPEEVRAATLSWARDLGWVLTEDQGSLLVFHLTRFSRWSGGLEMSVHVEGQEQGTWVNFTASQVITIPGQIEDLPRTARWFGHGICSDLQARGADVRSQWYGFEKSHPGRQQLAARDRLRRVTQCVLFAAVAPALAVFFLTGLDRGLILGVGALWVLLFMRTQVVRYRVVGMRADILSHFLKWALIIVSAGFVAIVLHVIGII